MIFVSAFIVCKRFRVRVLVSRALEYLFLYVDFYIRVTCWLDLVRKRAAARPTGPLPTIRILLDSMLRLNWILLLNRLRENIFKLNYSDGFIIKLTLPIQI